MKKVNKILAFGCLIWMPLLCFGDDDCMLSVSPVGFGDYDPFSTTPNDSQGSLTVSCKEQEDKWTIKLNCGKSKNCQARYLLNGIEQLNYYLYTDSGRKNIWDNKTKINGEGTKTLLIYGTIKEGQNVGAGTYTDTIQATLTEGPKYQTVSLKIR